MNLVSLPAVLLPVSSMFRRLSPYALIFCASLLVFASCSSLRARKRPMKSASPTPQPQPQFVGTISLVNDVSHFVLVDNGMLPSPPSGGMLKSFNGSNPTGDLQASDVRRHPFIIADIRSGAPQKGDRVYLQPQHGSVLPVPTATPPPAATPSPRAGNPLGLPPGSF